MGEVTGRGMRENLGLRGKVLRGGKECISQTETKGKRLNIGGKPSFGKRKISYSEGIGGGKGLCNPFKVKETTKSWKLGENAHQRGRSKGNM